ncbi:MAG: hypothetical protein ACLP9L_00875 [Thermoguttaceae bacterium]
MCTQANILIGFLATTFAVGTVGADGTNSSSSQSAANYTAINARAIATAFRLPSGTTLNSKQENAYAKLKTKYESTLREAMDLLHSKDAADKNKGLKLNRETRARIKTEIKELLATETAGAQQAASSGNGQQSPNSNGQQSPNNNGQQGPNGYNNASAYGSGPGSPGPASGPCPRGRR